MDRIATVIDVFLRLIQISTGGIKIGEEMELKKRFNGAKIPFNTFYCIKYLKRYFLERALEGKTPTLMPNIILDAQHHT